MSKMKYEVQMSKLRSCDILSPMKQHFSNLEITQILHYNNP